MTTDDTVAVLDVGGTHARSAVLDGDNRLHDLSVQATPSWTRCPGEGAAALHRRLVDLVVADARRLARRHPVTAPRDTPTAVTGWRRSTPAPA
jgi:hypothetical protein